MIKNKFVEYIDCHMHIDDPRKGRYCNGLSDWYNAPATVNRCKGCPFFKTEEQIMNERMKAAKVKKGI